MKTSVIDIGSNTIRLAVYKYRAGGGFEQIMSKKIVASLAGHIVDGRISEKGVSKLIESLVELKANSLGQGVPDIKAFSTASLRYVENAGEILERVLTETGLQIEMISGKEEARLSFLGARSALGMVSGLFSDIGGASCELITALNGEPVMLGSVPIGCLSLSVGFVTGILAKKDEVRQIKKHVRQQLESVEEQFREKSETLWAIGGTSRCIYLLAKELGFGQSFPGELSAAEVKTVTRALCERDTRAYRAVGNAIPDRFFTILPGAVILSEIMKKSGAGKMIVSKGGVREGYLLDRIITNKSGN